MSLSGVSVSHCGHSLSVSERISVRLSMTRLSVSEGLAAGSLQFWGKLFGVSADYLVLASTALGLNIRRQFYCSSDGGLTFAKLPKPDAFVCSVAPKLKGLLTGNASHKYRDPDAKKKKAAERAENRIRSAAQAQQQGQNDNEEDNDENDEEQEEEEEEEEDEDDGGEDEDGEEQDGDGGDDGNEDDDALTGEEAEQRRQQRRNELGDGADSGGGRSRRKQKPRRLSELERVAWTVECIDFCCCVVPKGLTVMSASGDISLNSAFAGLSIDDAKRIESYSLLRDAKLASTLSAIRRAGTANHTNFLDPIFATDGDGGSGSGSGSAGVNGSNSTVDSSAGLSGRHSWTLQVLDGGAMVQLRSLLWPGYEFTIETTHPVAHAKPFGGAYFGNGQRNDDLLFML